MELNKNVVQKIIALHQELMSKFPNTPFGTPKSMDSTLNVFSDPLYIEMSRIINGLNQTEKDDLVRLMYLGRDEDLDSIEDFENLKQEVSYEGAYDTDHILSKAPLADYLREGLKKMELHQ